jgi:hypothetical protein
MLAGAAAFAIAVGALAAGVHSGTSVAQAQPSGAAAIEYRAIDPGVFIPAPRASAIAAAHDDAAAQSHAAALWAGLTRRTDQKIAGIPLATFDTWYSPCDVYGPGRGDCEVNNSDPTQVTPSPLPASANGTPRTLSAGPRIATRKLTIPVQFFHSSSLEPTDVFSLVKYNREMAQFALPYASVNRFKALIGAGTTDIPDTINTHAIMTKPVYELLWTNKPTVLQVWAGPKLEVPPGATTSVAVPGSDTWTKIVVVVPDGMRYTPKPEGYCANTYDQNGNGTGHRFLKAMPEKVVKLSDFYTLPADAQTIVSIQDMRENFRRHQRARFHALGASAPPAACPLVVFDTRHAVEALVAMHVATAEYKHTWTWETYWYQPMLARGLPGSVGPFTHFDARTAWWTQDGNAFRYTFNPYLEGGFGRCTFLTNNWPGGGGTPGPCNPPIAPASPTPASHAMAGAANPVIPDRTNVSVPNLGRTTNCISCHSVATYSLQGPNANPGPGYVAHDKQPQTANIPQSIRVLNMWSMANDAPFVPSPSPAPTGSP